MVINVFYFVDTEKWLNVKPKLEKYNPLETKKKSSCNFSPSFWCTSRQGEKSVPHNVNQMTSLLYEENEISPVLLLEAYLKY